MKPANMLQVTSGLPIFSPLAERRPILTMYSVTCRKPAREWDLDDIIAGWSFQSGLGQHRDLEALKR